MSGEPNIGDILRAQADKAVERIDDSGLLFNVIPIPEPGAYSMCWRCVDKTEDKESNSLGLCTDCYTWLHVDDNVATHEWRKGI